MEKILSPKNFSNGPSNISLLFGPSMSIMPLIIVQHQPQSFFSYGTLPCSSHQQKTHHFLPQSATIIFFSMYWIWCDSARKVTPSPQVLLATLVTVSTFDHGFRTDWSAALKTHIGSSIFYLIPSLKCLQDLRPLLLPQLLQFNSITSLGLHLLTFDSLAKDFIITWKNMVVKYHQTKLNNWKGWIC